MSKSNNEKVLVVCDDTVQEVANLVAGIEAGAPQLPEPNRDAYVVARDEIVRARIAGAILVKACW